MQAEKNFCTLCSFIHSDSTTVCVHQLCFRPLNWVYQEHSLGTYWCLVGETQVSNYITTMRKAARKPDQHVTGSNQLWRSIRHKRRMSSPEGEGHFKKGKPGFFCKEKEVWKDMCIWGMGGILVWVQLKVVNSR